MDYTNLIYSIQRSNIKHDDRPFVVTAVQEYIKVLEACKAVRNPKVKAKKTKE
jgi:hypothetical protein